MNKYRIDLHFYVEGNDTETALKELQYKLYELSILETFKTDYYEVEQIKPNE